jgi:hypothetical protein
MKTIFFIFLQLSLLNSLWAAKEDRVFLDQHYGSHERQVFDLWLPKSAKKAPLVIYIHGGGFVMGSKDEIRTNKIIKKYQSCSNKLKCLSMVLSTLIHKFKNL